MNNQNNYPYKYQKRNFEQTISKNNKNNMVYDYEEGFNINGTKRPKYY